MAMAGLDFGEPFVLADLEGCSFSLVLPGIARPSRRSCLTTRLPGYHPAKPGVIKAEVYIYRRTPEAAPQAKPEVIDSQLHPGPSPRRCELATPQAKPKVIVGDEFHSGPSLRSSMAMAGLDFGEAFVLADLEGCSFSLVCESTLSCSSCPARLSQWMVWIKSKLRKLCHQSI